MRLLLCRWQVSRKRCKIETDVGTQTELKEKGKQTMVHLRLCNVGKQAAICFPTPRVECAWAPPCCLDLLPGRLSLGRSVAFCARQHSEVLQRNSNIWLVLHIAKLYCDSRLNRSTKVALPKAGMLRTLLWRQPNGLRRLPR